MIEVYEKKKYPKTALRVCTVGVSDADTLTDKRILCGIYGLVFAARLIGLTNIGLKG